MKLVFLFIILKPSILLVALVMYEIPPYVEIYDLVNQKLSKKVQFLVLG